MKYQVITEIDGVEPWVEATFDTKKQANDYINEQLMYSSDAYYMIKEEAKALCL